MTVTEGEPRPDLGPAGYLARSALSRATARDLRSRAATVCAHSRGVCARARALCAGATAINVATVDVLTRQLVDVRLGAERARARAAVRRARAARAARRATTSSPTVVRRPSNARQAASECHQWASMMVHGTRSVRTADGAEWAIREVDTHDQPGARADRCLIFGGQALIRRVWSYPAEWTVLSDAALLALADLDRRQ